MAGAQKRPGGTGAIQKPRPAYLSAFARLYGDPKDRRFHPDRLPDAADYYSGRFGTLRPNASGWMMVRCCFHADRRPSLSINIITGAFRCFSCGAHGGDVLAFHRQQHGLSFREAARDLGAWRCE